jgi:DNA gyrase subunit A
LDAREKLMSIGFDVSGIVDLILSSDDRALVKDNVCYLTETQARAILDMRLARLTALEKDKLVDEVNKIAATIKDLFEILSSRERLISIIKEELIYIRNTFGKERLTEIDSSSLEHDIEDLIKREDMVVTVTLSGYIKRVPLSSYKSQKRGGKGRLGLAMNDNDVTTQIFVANTLTPMLFFSSKGIVYSMKLYKLPVGNPQTKGRPIINLLKLEEGETITKIIALPEDKEELADLQILFITSSGLIRKNSMDDFKKIQSNGKIAFRLEEEGVSLVSVNLCKKDDHILIATKLGKCIRFSVDKIRVFKSRTSEGVRAIKLQEGDQVISAAVINSAEFDMELRAKYLSIPRDVRKNIAKTNEAQEGFSEIPTDTLINLANKEQFILTVTENGFGKRTSSYEYRVTGRSGSGIVNMITSERNGSIIASLPVSDYDQVMFITNEGKLIRCPVDAIRITGRVAKGVCVFKLNELEKIVSVALIAKDEDEEELSEEELREQNALLLQASGIIANASEDDSIIMEEIEEIEDDLADEDDFDEE